MQTRSTALWRLSPCARIRDYFGTSPARIISRLQVPTALRPYRTLGKHKRFAPSAGTVFVFTDHAFDDATLAIGPLDASPALAGAAEPESLLGRTALPRYVYESRINHDAFFRKRHRAIP